MIGSLSRKYVRAGKFLMPYCLASRLSLILTKSTPKWSVSSSIFSSSANTLSHVVQLLASGISQYQLNINHNSRIARVIKNIYLFFLRFCEAIIQITEITYRNIIHIQYSSTEYLQFHWKSNINISILFHQVLFERKGTELTIISSSLEVHVTEEGKLIPWSRSFTLIAALGWQFQAFLAALAPTSHAGVGLQSFGYG